MADVIEKNPTSWGVDGNLIDETVSNPTGTEPFTLNDCSMTLESGVLIDGNLLIPLLVESDW